VIKASIALGLAIYLSGCTALSVRPNPNNLGIGGLGEALSLPESRPTLKQAVAFDVRWAHASPTKENAHARVSALTHALVAESDLRCDHYMTSISIDRNTTRGSLDIVGLALSTIGGVASPNRSSNWFSAGSSIAQSSRRSLEDTVFGGREFGLIYTAVWQGRDDARNSLINEINNGQLDYLPPGGVLALVRRYDLKCGINYGLSELTRRVASDRPVSGGQGGQARYEGSNQRLDGP